MDIEKKSLYTRPDIYDIHFSDKMVNLLRKHYEVVLCKKDIITIHDCSFDTRNWDRILNNQQRFYYYQPIFRENERINAMQVWDYNSEGTITFNLLYSFEKDAQIYRREEFKEQYYPLKKEFLVNALENLGFENIEIHNFIHHDVKDFGEMEWYIMIAQKKD